MVIYCYGAVVGTEEGLGRMINEAQSYWGNKIEEVEAVSEYCSEYCFGILQNV